MSVKYIYSLDSFINIKLLKYVIDKSAMVNTAFEKSKWNGVVKQLDIEFDQNLNTGDKDLLDNFISTAGAYPSNSSMGAKLFYIKEYDEETNYILKSIWYATDNGDGTYSDIVEETVYTYSDGILASYVVKEFLIDGTEVSVKEFEYYTSSAEGINSVILKEIVSTD